MMLRSLVALNGKIIPVSYITDICSPVSLAFVVTGAEANGTVEITTRRKKSRKVIFCPVERELSCMCGSVSVRLLVSYCMYARMFLCIYTYMLMKRQQTHTYTHRRTQTHTDTHTQTYRHTHAERQAYLFSPL